MSFRVERKGGRSGSEDRRREQGFEGNVKSESERQGYPSIRGGARGSSKGGSVGLEGSEKLQ